MFERDGVDIAWAKVTTLGSSVVDLFGIVVPASDDSGTRSATSSKRTCTAVLPTPPPAKPAAEAS